jgi:hypothetical protein
MKKLFQHLGIMFSFVFVQGITAQNITIDAAMTAGNNCITVNQKPEFRSSKLPESIHSGSQILAFVFELQPHGFIVVSANSSLPPVIAYSFESNFGDLTPDNPLYSMLLADLNKRLMFADINTPYAEKNQLLWEALLNEPSRTGSREQWPSTGDGWLKTNWTQNAPYNNFCPMDAVSGQRSIAGCPAVAMAQIVNFHETINTTSFNDGDDYYHNYAGRQFYIDDDYFTLEFPSFPMLNEYLDTLSAHWQHHVLPDNNDKAALTFACGVACKQVYTSSGSGTFGVNQAYDAYLRFGFTTVELLGETDTSLYTRLIQNIKDTLPAHLAVVDSGWTMGHNVVVDGYNTDNYFHINFGWGGSYNGWYLLPQEIPYNLTVIEGLIVDIIPVDFTAIADNTTHENRIQLYPNPASQYLYVSNFSSDDLSFDIYSLDGKHVLSQKGSKADIADLESGNYFVIVRSLNRILGKSMITIIK